MTVTTKKSPAAPVEHSEQAAVTAAATNPPIRLLSRTEVLEVVGVSYASLWGWIKEGTFPPGRALVPGKKSRICWIESEVMDWIRSRPVRLPKGSKQRAA